MTPGFKPFTGNFSLALDKLKKKALHALFSLRKHTHQGHPTTVFGKIFVRGSKYCLEVSIALERLKISRCLFHLCKIFGVFLLTSLQFSKVGIFTFHFPDLVNISLRKDP